MSYQAGEDEDEDQTQDTGEGEDTDTSGDDQEEPAAADSGESDEDDGPEAPAATPAAGEMGPSVNASNLTDDQKLQHMKDYLSGKYGEASDDSKIKTAQEDAKSANRKANIAEAFETMAKAKSMAYGGAGVDKSYYQGLKNQAQQGVTQAQQARDAAIKDFMTKNQLGRDAADDSRKATSFQNEQDKAKVWKDENTPGSETSKRVISSFNKTFPQFAISDDDAQHLSAADVKGYISGNVDIAAKIQANREATAMRNQLHGDQKAKEQDIAFAGKFDKLREGYNKATSDLEKQDHLIEQAASGQGGIAGALVKGGALHEALGRVSQGELGMAQDPSIMEGAKRLYNKITNGETLTDKDVAEYKAINAANHKATDDAFMKSASEMTETNDRASRHPGGYSASLVGLKAPSHGSHVASSASPVHGSGVANAAPAHGADDKITTYAAAHNLNYEAAKAILVKRGYQPNEQ